MLKITKIITILFIFLLFITPFSLATDIDMNLPGNNNSNTVENPNEELENEMANINENEISTNAPSTQVTSGSSVSDETLGITNILNILLIVIGVVLILLGIAILIRMHS